MLFGVDTASVAGNKNVSWTRAKAEGPISFAFVRSNWGTTVDSFFTKEWDKLKSAGLIGGTYMFLRFRNAKHPKAPAPKEQAQVMIDAVGQRLERKRDFPPVVDVEFPGKGAVETGMTPQQLLDGIRIAWDMLAQHFGVPPIIYTSGRVWKEDLRNIPAPSMMESPLWLARYPFKSGQPAIRDAARAAKIDPPVPVPWGDKDNWFIHQYQGDATQMPGFPTGNVDMNRFNTVSKGDKGGNVRWVQRRLKLPTQSGTMDQSTESALRAFQTSRGLTADGVVGPKTFAALCWS
jgi:lysozyme